MDSEPQRTRDRRAILAFAVGAAFFLAFFATGAYVGRWSRAVTQTESIPTSAEAPASRAMFRVLVASFDTRDKADDALTALRRKYTSATIEPVDADGKLRLYVGPYPSQEAEAVAGELRELGHSGASLEPFGR